VPQVPSFEATYAAVANERRYIEIFDRLETAFPALYKRSIQIFRASAEAPLPGVDLSDDEKAFVQSQAYSAAAKLAQEIDPNYNLDFLRR
jgi:hypothetical protein